MEPEYLTTAEVAERLRLAERSVYELVRTRRIPCSRVAGKWLFPRRLVDAWVLAGLQGEAHAVSGTPAVVAGSHDPLLAWVVAHSGCGLQMHPGGSFDGLRKLAAGQARVIALHLPDGDGGPGANRAAVRALASPADAVLLRFATRRQGLLVAPGNPLGLVGVADLAQPGLRVALRGADAGSRALLERLLAQAGLDTRRLQAAGSPVDSEEALALAVLEGRADAGLGIEAMACRFGLGFVPVHVEHLDLALSRRDAFEPEVQRLLAFASAPQTATRAQALGGYVLERPGEVLYNR